MAARRSFAPTRSTQIDRSRANNLRKSTSYDFRIQSAPPLSLQQHARSQAIIASSKPWNQTGKYQTPTFKSYLSPQIREKPKASKLESWKTNHKLKYPLPNYTLKIYKDPKPKPPEPVWHHQGRTIDKRPTSLSPETRPQKKIHESVWRHPGRSIDKPPTSLSPETRPKKPINERVWKPTGKIEHKPVPFFDPPNLRWSLEQLRRSMPDLRTRSQYKKDF